MKWQTKDGKILNHYDMDTNHIENSIKLMRRRIGESLDFLSSEENQNYALSLADAEDYKKNCEVIIRIFDSELRYRRMGKPRGEIFPQPVIQPWELRSQMHTFI